jgi:hypothetical protein
MGRPISRKYLGNTKLPQVGGESILSIVVANSGTGYTSTATLVFPSPQLTGGVTATGILTIAGGNITSVQLTSAGGGYLSTPVPTVTAPGSGATFTVGLSSVINAIKFNAWVIGDTQARASGDIVRQRGSHRYLVKTSGGQGICNLATTSTLTAGQLSIGATDTNGSTYYVAKLTARKALLVQSTASGSFLFDNNSIAKWGYTAGTGIVSIANN